LLQMEQSDRGNITVFYNDVAIHLTDHKNQDNPNTVFIRSQSDIERFLDRFFKYDSIGDIVLKANNKAELFGSFQSYFKSMRAAGGIVKNCNNDLLLIKRFGIWDLPKGKLEDKENLESCALREVAEETGVSGLHITGELPPTYHIYLREGKYFLKKTRWFRMFTESSEELKPQLKEDITEAVWMGREEAKKALLQSYRSIKDILLPNLTD